VYSLKPLEVWQGLHGDTRGLQVRMINPDNRLFCRLDGLTVSAREQQRLSAIAALSLLEPNNIPVFDEATQTVAHFVDAPVCTLSLMIQNCQRFKSSIGLSRLGSMNELAISRQCLRSESFCTHVVDSHQVLAIEDTFVHPAFANNLLTQQYGVRAYLGVPLMTSSGLCIGSLAVMDLKPRQFTIQEIEFMELTARWSMSEFERQQAIKNQVVRSTTASRDDDRKDTTDTPSVNAQGTHPNSLVTNQIKVELLSQLTQELRTPLTSVMGMASVLTREIYGPLTHKQKEYLDIIHHSGQYLLSLVNEILELSSLKDGSHGLNLTSVDIEMLCQQAINTLEQAAFRREQQIRLSVEPGRRIWLLDKDKVRQLLYHLTFSVIQSSNAGSIIRLHVSHRANNLVISIWMSHPWLGEGLPYADITAQSLLMPIAATSDAEFLARRSKPSLERGETNRPADNDAFSISTTDSTIPLRHSTHEASPTASLNRNLGLLLSRQLIEMHSGQITIQGAAESGYRYVISLPQLSETGVVAHSV